MFSDVQLHYRLRNGGFVHNPLLGTEHRHVGGVFLLQAQIPKTVEFLIDDDKQQHNARPEFDCDLAVQLPHSFLVGGLSCGFFIFKFKNIGKI